jgi:membrane protease YdiL (CAAX protease family)
VTVIGAAIAARRSSAPAAWLAPVGLLAALGAIVLLRAWATRAGADPLLLGVVFGVALASIALIGRGRPGRPAARSVAVGIMVGVGLAASTIIASSSAGLGVGNLLGRPAAPFVPWAVIIVLVAVAEEAIVRGRLFDAIRRAGGVGVALAVTTAAFALMHVPLYGWHVVPLDLAVGLALGGLRVATGGIAAPAAAHAIADLATWWL